MQTFTPTLADLQHEDLLDEAREVMKELAGTRDEG